VNSPTPTVTASALPPASSAASVAPSSPSLHDSLPAAIRASGVINAGTDATYPPFETLASDKKTVVGFDADLAAAIGQQLGVTIQFQQIGFSDLIPALQSNRFDVAISAIGDFKKREAQVDFVDYYLGGSSFLVKTGSNLNVNTVDDLCGHSVGASTGTDSQRVAQDQNTKCKAAGKAGVTVQVYQDETTAVLALGSGRVEIVMADSATNGYVAKQSNGQFESVGQSFYTTKLPYGMAVAKGSPLEMPLMTAINNLISDGTYKTLLAKWGLDKGAIDQSGLNGATT